MRWKNSIGKHITVVDLPKTTSARTALALVDKVEPLKVVHIEGRNAAIGTIYIT